MTLPKPVVDALTILQGAYNTLGQISSNGYGAAGVIPGSVAVPTPTTISVQNGTQGVYNLPVYQDRTFILVPQAQYAQWASAWAILMGYAGWWGARAAWPLGDGTRAMTDTTAAATLPPSVSAMTTIQSTLAIVQAPTWTPDVRWTAIGSLVLVAVGGIAAWLGARRFAEDHLHGLQGRDRGAAMLGWNLGRFMTHALRRSR